MHVFFFQYENGALFQNQRAVYSSVPAISLRWLFVYSGVHPPSAFSKLPTLG